MDKRAVMDFAVGLVRDGTLRVDADGSLWRVRATIHGVSRPVVPRRAENVGGKGYLRLTLQVPGRGLVQVMAHRLVWEVVNGPIPDGQQINHKDLDKANNAPANLEPVDASGNIRHSYANGRRAPWSDATMWRGRARVSPETMAAVRAARSTGAIYRDIAARFGISITHAQRICTAT